MKSSVLGVLIFVAASLCSGCAHVITEEPSQPVIDIVEPVVEKEEEVVLIDIGTTFDLPIVSFHHIGPAPITASNNDRTWYLSTTTFRSILDEISDAGYTTYTMAEILSYVEDGKIPEKAIVLTFDDRHLDFYTHAWPILQEYNAKSVLYISAGIKTEKYLTDDHLRELAASPLIEIGSHTMYHAYLTRISAAEQRYELGKSKEVLEEVIGKPVMSLAYPFGLYNAHTKQLAAEAGYTSGLTINAISTHRVDDPMAMHRYIVTEQTDFSSILE